MTNVHLFSFMSPWSLHPPPPPHHRFYHPPNDICWSSQPFAQHHSTHLPQTHLRQLSTLESYCCSLSWRLWSYWLNWWHNYLPIETYSRFHIWDAGSQSRFSHLVSPREAPHECPHLHSLWWVVTACGRSRSLWTNLETLFSSHSQARLMQVWHQLATLKKGTQPIAD